MWVPARRFDPEWMDRPDNRFHDVREALRDIRFVNRSLGGRRTLLRGLDRVLDDHASETPLEVLDVGTGGADLPLEMVLHGRRRDLPVHVTAIDLDASATRVAAESAAGRPEVRVLRADATRLPFGPASFDVVTASMFLHHFDHEGVVGLLRGFRRVARRAVVINDLRRHRLPWAVIRATSRVTGRSPMFAHDAPLSVLRGFTEDELRRAARDSSVEHPRITRLFPFRLLMILPGDCPLFRQPTRATKMKVMEKGTVPSGRP